MRCRVCGEEKDESCFRLCCNGNGRRKTGAKSVFRRTECRECEKAYKREYHRKNREKRLREAKDYRASHKEETKLAWKRYYINHRDELAQKHKKWAEEHPDYSKEWYQSHKKEILDKQKIRLKTDPLYAFKRRERNRIRTVFRAFGKKKDSRTADLVGCSNQQLYEHLVHTFERNYGLSWDNNFLPEVDIDHIIPLASARTIEDAKKLFRWENLQLLRREDNQHKLDTMPS